jgi:hypothetical protein
VSSLTGEDDGIAAANDAVAEFDASISLSAASWLDDPVTCINARGGPLGDVPTGRSASTTEVEELSLSDAYAFALSQEQSESGLAAVFGSQPDTSRSSHSAEKAPEARPKKRVSLPPGGATRSPARRRRSSMGSTAVAIAPAAASIVRYKLKDRSAVYAVHGVLLLLTFVGTVVLSMMVLPRDEQCEVFAVSFAIGVFVVDLVGVQSLYALVLVRSKTHEEWCVHPL